MTKQEQITFVSGLIDNVKKDLLHGLEKVDLPEEWDGHELRQLVADRFAEASFTLKENKRRHRAYRNFILTHPRV